MFPTTIRSNGTTTIKVATRISLITSVLESISSTFYARVFRSKFWRQKLRSWLLGLKLKEGWGQKSAKKVSRTISAALINLLMFN